MKKSYLEIVMHKKKYNSRGMLHIVLNNITTNDSDVE